mmetsp:Transcript_35539/g.110880  ORF Transcript_35539/g.110880 Transcript_35539/m.110880 type:complete len:200 (+) Transcript_35539:64-663(+)|eukprot:CAMPEP_0204571002 /NCGR_PEP_ID=MMETSP0661-20131031/38637_1 /ASSEMBLY_ACC=CAM_ASM_000606 /TAXON_ID=109239 /ORGANISM="Alexandrium margalefi, Strain AMGDE01CS-322" /LENGTH=199 /DNA_ID=CAMNT_0051579227 /DNA_START=61 /DNA_END=660 /DNA_ORIENTATION=-
MEFMTVESWWAAMKTNHAVFGIAYFEGATRSTGDKTFTFLERCIFLGMAVAAAWYGVYLKYFYLRRWVPVLFDQVLDEVGLFPPDWIEDHIDSVLCSILGGAVDALLGKELVRTILKKDWDSKDGLQWVVQVLTLGWCVVLMLGALVLMAQLCIEKPHLQMKLLLKWMTTVIMKLALVETAIQTVKAAIASRAAKSKDA